MGSSGYGDYENSYYQAILETKRKSWVYAQDPCYGDGPVSQWDKYKLSRFVTICAQVAKDHGWYV